VRLKARLSSAFSTTSELDDFASMVADKAPAKVILFGSHARGDADEGSDFDSL
jgi:predicted nucleotidyltransferase